MSLDTDWDRWEGMDVIAPVEPNPFDPQRHPDEHAAFERQTAGAREEVEQAKERRRQERKEAKARYLEDETERELVRLKARHAAEQRWTQEQAELAKAAADDAARVHDGATFLLDLPPTPPALWGKGEDILWARGEALMIAGPQGVGKTTIAGQLLRAVAGITGDVLGYPVEPCERRILYLAMDRPEQARRNLARMFADAEVEIGRDYLAEILRFWSGPPPSDFAADPAALLRLAQQHDADVVFVDSLKDAAVGLSKDEVGAGYNRARQLALAEGVQLVELHHVVKSGADGAKPNNINGIYGSTWLTSGAGSVVMLWGDPGDPVIELLHLKQPMNEVGPLSVRHNRETGLSEVFHDEDTDVVALARRCAETGVSAAEAARCQFSTETPSKAQVEKARRKLRQLVKQGLLTERAATDGKGGRGNGDRWFAVAPASWVVGEEAPDDRYQ
ncbi:AAA family ATPase [Micromonospora sp. WMMC241]|uniref:AAA family ATPase n=1 Tax=Micromonospora sp. WMMC241 TaxID=3015159 RepID=UPI0022B6E9D1|nr:AAA family ATPase [Micromonospora sp. WMMC241]MCZ7434783.1 AAA family ATPase [Micromonospora sp. WMMC241]MCZ7440838.1 AAA family ATPase [Micromonospora sp. WMMC241]MCZ7440907.1 AAA family ATPase [Micromonospora sp. WMMC241]